MPEFVHLFTDRWIFRLFPVWGLLQIKLLGTFIVKFLYDISSLFFLDKYQRVEWLAHMVGMCLTV